MVKTIAYFGPAGTYTEEAALKYDPEADLRPYPTIAAVADATASGETDEGVVPIENSLEGSVTYTLDLLISQSDLLISNEVVLLIEHYLMAKPGVKFPDIQIIYSHPQSLAQCRNYLERSFPNAQQIASMSNATAVADMQTSVVSAAAIAPRRAALLYEAEIIAEKIQDSAANFTRFAVLRKTDHPPTGHDKTSMCLSLRQDLPGSLHNALGVFARRRINLTKIESRPTKETLGRYIFLIDCEGHREDLIVKEALMDLQGQVIMLKVLGSYPRWDFP